MRLQKLIKRLQKPIILKGNTDSEEKDSRFGCFIFNVFMRSEEFGAGDSDKAHAHSAHTRKAKERASLWTV